MAEEKEQKGFLKKFGKWAPIIGGAWIILNIVLPLALLRIPTVQKVLVALGETERFNLIYEEYMKAKEITRDRILLETMSSILPKVNKVVADKSVGGNVLPFLPIGQALNDLNK